MPMPIASEAQTLFDFDSCCNFCDCRVLKEIPKVRFGTYTTKVIKEMPFMRVLCGINTRHNCKESRHNFYSIRFLARIICLEKNVSRWLLSIFVALASPMKVISAAYFVVIHCNRKRDNPFIWSFGSYLIRFFLRAMMEQQWLPFYAIPFFQARLVHCKWYARMADE